MVRRGGEPSVAKNAAREAATKKEYCDNFMGHYFKQCNKHSTQLGHQAAEANRTFDELRKMFNLPDMWGLRPDSTNRCRHVPLYRARSAE